MPERSRTCSIERHFPTDTQAAKDVLDEVLGSLSAHQWTADEVFGVHLALEEALMNAIKHGNQLDANKSVHVRTEVCREWIRIEIADQGDGFVLSDVPDPTLDENLDLPSGRGLMLIRTFMTSVEYNEKGNRVTMVKHRTAS
ncbi:MAG: ATP-binding protein [Planctomycetes bacterium]|nr:ATP-binding protein [Planctomycetota bacterium]